MTKFSKKFSALFALLLLTGCSSQPEVAYWVDASYKSAMNYEAEQMYELKDELKAISTIVNDMIDSGTLDDVELADEVDKDAVNDERGDEEIVWSYNDYEDKLTVIRETVREKGYATGTYYTIGDNNDNTDSKYLMKDSLGYDYVDVVAILNDGWSSTKIDTLQPHLADQLKGIDINMPARRSDIVEGTIAYIENLTKPK